MAAALGVGLTSGLTQALKGASQLLHTQGEAMSSSLTVHSRSTTPPSQLQKVTVTCSSVVVSGLSGGFSAACVSGTVVDWAADVTGSMCSPPRTGTAKSTRGAAVAPAYCLAGRKTRRRRHRPEGDNGNGNDNSGGFGGGDDGSRWHGDESGGDDDVSEGFWMWQVLCVISMVQALQFVLDQARGGAATKSAPAFATLSQTFFSSGPRLRRQQLQPPQAA